MLFFSVLQLVFYHPPGMIVLRFSIASLSIVIYLIATNFLGQRVIDSKAQVFYTVYHQTEWYRMSPKHRRMILLIQNRSINCSSGLSAGKMGSVSLETAGIVIDFFSLCS